MIKHKKKIIIGILLVVVVVTCIVVFENKSKKTQPIPTNNIQRTETVKRGTVINSTYVTGEVQAIEDVILTSRIIGEVSNVSVSKGDYVKKGDLLLIFDTKRIDNRIEKAEIAIRKNAAQLSGARSQNINTINKKNELKNKYDLKVNELRNKEILYNNGAISLSELEQVKIAVQAAYNAYTQASNNDNSSVTIAELECLELKIDCDNLLVEREYYELVSTIEGVVVDIFVVEGEVVGEREELIHIVNTKNLKVYGIVNEFEADNLALGNIFEISKYGELYTGEITYISPIIKTVTIPARGEEKVIEVEGILYDEETLLLPGSEIRMNLILQKSEDTLMVSQQSVYNNQYVIKSEEGNYILVKVKTGVQDLMNIEVISEEITEGDVILVNPPHDLIESLRY